MTQLIDAPTRAVARARRDRWLLLIPPAATLAVCLIGIDSASLWRDEAATLDAEARPISGLLRMLIHVDAVHGLYYLLLWPVVHAFGSGEFAVRFPSGLAMAAAAYGTGQLGSQLHSRRAGISAGLVFAALPQVSRYGQEMRSYALVVAVAVLATCLLLRALANPRRRNWIAYACAVSLLGLLNLFALLLLLAHARFARRQARVWLVTAGLACIPAVPIVTLAVNQQDQLSWVVKPDLNAGGALAVWLAGSVLSVVLASVLIGLFLGRKPGHALTRLAIPWLVLPPIVLILGSELKPVYVQRYLAFCLPALALLIGAGLATITVGPRVIGLLLLTVLGTPTQSAIRQVGGHGDDIRDAASILGQRARAGDGVLFNCPPCHYQDMPREFAFAYPQAFADLIDVAVATAPSASDTLRGTDLDHPTINVNRVWVVDVDGSTEPSALRATGFRLVSIAHAGNITIEDYERE
ncbi:MAG TPA: glycosyltransferase family 39 protein [Pseudonocardiaceae bacterium]|nr:glycosyltransferase family 39 protein [Pseudonocardiaceae bacterium]